jgi:hypothetical protein
MELERVGLSRSKALSSNTMGLPLAEFARPM